MYRELTAVALERGADLDDEAALAALVGVRRRRRRATCRLGAGLAPPSAPSPGIPQVRERMRALQRSLAEPAAVLEGRDTGTQVCPERRSRST